jgi:hypothetical protein
MAFNKNSIAQIRDQHYNIEIEMYNMINSPFIIPFKNVEALVVEESLENWWVKGWIILKNDFEIIERGSKAVIEKTASSGGQVSIKETASKVDPFYHFRHDGRNKLHIRIMPIGDLPENLWEMNYDLVVYDIEDMPSSNSIRKSKKLYFVDERYQLFSERNIEWSTSTHGPASKQSAPVWSLPDESRTMNSNMAIASIIQTAAGNDPNNVSGLKEVKVGFTELGSIVKPDIPIDNINLQKWNSDGALASPSETSIFYTSPANAKVIDDLKYVMHYTKGSDNGPVFLKFDRTKNKEWHLWSLTDFFSKTEQIERLILQDGIESTQNVYIGRAPVTGKDNIINFTNGRASLIKNYKFSPMVAIDDARITNRPMHHYDFSTGEYSINYEDNTATKVVEKLKEIASNGLFNFTGGSKGVPQLLLNVNKTKQAGLNLVNHLSVQNHGPSNFNQIKMIKDSIFLNQGLYFQSEGLTFRTPGKFIFVDRVDSNDFNAFDDKFLGQWFVTKVVHFFTQDQYLTDVVATKIDCFNKNWEELDSNY